MATAKKKCKCAGKSCAHESAKTSLPPLPKLKKGEIYVGIIHAADGSRSYQLILLPREAKNKTFTESNAWAKQQGGELPDRVEGALMFAMMRSAFEKTGYWTREQLAYVPCWAWVQDFSYGPQCGYHKGNRWHARAVRKIKL